MNAFFLQLVRLSLTTVFLVPAVLLLRLVLRRAPRWMFCVLWGLVALRLVCPAVVESPFSLLPESVGSGAAVSRWAGDYAEEPRVLYDGDADYDAAVAAGRTPVRDQNGSRYVLAARDGLGEPATVAETVVPTLSRIWLAGAGLLLLYTLGSSLLLKRRVATATPLREGVRQSERVTSPFVLGVLRPVIYLPYEIAPEDLEAVIAHERAHIRRGDPWWKLVGFLILSVYWFNPLVWVAYLLFCGDVEAACDEKVIREMGEDGRRAYAAALLRCGVRRRVAACPLAFGGSGVKSRIRRVMDYRRPTVWILLLAVAAAAVTAVCLMTAPADGRGLLSGERRASGRIVRLETNPQVGVTSFILRTEKGETLGLLLTDETYVFSFVEGMDARTFRAGPETEVAVSVVYSRPREPLTDRDGGEVPTYCADQIEVTSYLKAHAALPDGTDTEVWQNSTAAVYTLPDGTELLYVRNPVGPENVTVGGGERLDRLSEKAQKEITAYYRRQGLLYDERAELENAYAAYLKAEDPSEFESRSLSQEVLPSASSGRIVYFVTCVRHPLDGAYGYETRIGAAFDRVSGEPVDPRTLFSCPPEEVGRRLLALGGPEDPTERAALEREFRPENLIFTADVLEIWFPRNTLALDYDGGLSELLYRWAVPERENS